MRCYNICGQFFPNFIHFLSSVRHFLHARKFWLTPLAFLGIHDMHDTGASLQISKGILCISSNTSNLSCIIESFMDDIQPLRLVLPMHDLCMLFSFHGFVHFPDYGQLECFLCSRQTIMIIYMQCFGLNKFKHVLQTISIRE